MGIDLSGRRKMIKRSKAHKTNSKKEKTTHKQTVIVAPTGIAALNAGGVTIHSFFQLPFGAFIPEFGAGTATDSLKIESKSKHNFLLGSGGFQRRNYCS